MQIFIHYCTEANDETYTERRNEDMGSMWQVRQYEYADNLTLYIALQSSFSSGRVRVSGTRGHRSFWHPPSP